MSDNFKFLTQASETSNTSDKAFAQEDAAQSFLDKKLSKNRFTQQQQETLDANGGSKDFGSEYNKVITNQDEIDAFNARPPSGGDSGLIDKYGSLSDLGFDNARIEAIRNHASGAKGSNAFGYSSDTEHHFRETNNATGAGSIEADMRKIGKHMGYEHWGTANPERIRQYIMQQKAPEVKAPEPIEKLVKIEHSPEIEQAKERVATYENDVLSGKVSEDIYGSRSDYTFDATKGAAGIGTPMSGDSKEQAQKATASFLDNKKWQLKDKYQFEAQS